MPALRNLHRLKSVIGAKQWGFLLIHISPPAVVIGLGNDNQRGRGCFHFGIDLFGLKLLSQHARGNSVGHRHHSPRFGREEHEFCSVKIRAKQERQGIGVIKEDGLLTGGDEREERITRLPFDIFARCGHL